MDQAGLASAFRCIEYGLRVACLWASGSTAPPALWGIPPCLDLGRE